MPSKAFKISVALLLVSLYLVNGTPIRLEGEDQIRKAAPLREDRLRNLQQLKQEICDRNRRSVKEFCTAVTKKTVQTMSPLAMAYLSDSCASAMGVTDGMMGYGSMIKMQGYSEAIRATMQTLMEQLFGCSSNLQQQYEKLWKVLVDNSKDSVKELPPSVRQLVAKIDDQIKSRYVQSTSGNWWSLSMYPSYSSSNDDFKPEPFYELLRMRETVLLAFPTKTLNVAGFELGGDSQYDSLMNSRLEQIMSSLTEDSKRSLRALVSKIRVNSIDSKPKVLEEDEPAEEFFDSEEELSDSEDLKKRNFDTLQRAQAYFYGEPGTGKTRFARLLAKALGLPVCEISLKKDNFDSLYGTDLTFENQELDQSPGKKDKVIFGEIFMCIVNSGVVNPIIFVDEAGDDMRNSQSNPLNNNLIRQLKLLTDTSSSSISIVGGQTELDISRVTFIFAGNYELRDPALKSRLPQVTFGKIDDSIKRKLIKDQIAESYIYLKSRYSKAITEKNQ